MRTYPDTDYSQLNTQTWQLEVLKLNPDYTSWGVYEDYMSKTGSGWDGAQIFEKWSDFGPWTLDCYNEVVNFYFETKQPSHECQTCGGTGMNPATKQLSEDWYNRGATGQGWKNNIGDVEILALAQANRLDLLRPTYRYDSNTLTWYRAIDGEMVIVDAPEMPTASEVNRSMKTGIGHDAISRYICVMARAKHLGVYGDCPECEDGIVYESIPATTSLQLWFLHPRKGCSRGVLVESIQESELETILAYLTQAATRNADRFSKLETYKPTSAIGL